MTYVDEKIKYHKSRRLNLVGLSVLCVSIFIMTIHILIQPADSMVNDTECGIAEHIHTDSCYSVLSEAEGNFLACGFNSNGNIVHSHDDFCYDGENNLICPLAELSHEHDSSCYDENGSVICGITIHQHNVECFSLYDGGEHIILVCNTEEHTHTDECYCLNISEPSEVTEAEAENISPVVMYEDDINENEAFINTEISDCAEISLFNTALNPLDITETDKLQAISLSYQDSNGAWINIDENIQSDLPVNCAYRFAYKYNDLTLESITDARNQLIIRDCIPHWTDMDKFGTFMYNSQPVGTINIIDGENDYKSVLITFNDDFIGNLPENTVALSGKFYILGNIAWENLDNENKGIINHPKINMTLQFEKGNLPQKYGRIDIIKSNPKCVGDNMLEYVLTVTSLSSVDIPEVFVDDCFIGNTGSFIEEYITDGDNAPYEITENQDGTETENHVPNITATAGISMKWDLGILRAGETRKLVYCVRTNEYYMGSASRGELVNNAKVYSGNILKDEDNSTFIPNISVSMKKSEKKFDVDDYGTGYITYQININSGSRNSYDIVNLRLRDYFNLQDINGGNINDGFKSAITFVENEDYPLTAVSNKGREVVVTAMEDDDPDNAMFEFYIDRLCPNETVTVTYSVKTDCLYRYINDYGTQLLNTVQIYGEKNADRKEVSDRCFATSTTKHWFNKNQWIRKLDGGDVTEEKTITIPESDFVYDSDKNHIENSGISFNIPKDSKEYVIILNEKGLWDLSSTTLSDAFNDEHITYTGYVKVEQYDIKDKSGSESEILSNMNGTDPVKTAWLDVGGKGNFSFAPENIGLGGTDERYAYRLTYYATPVNMEGMGKIIIANSFSASGTIGVGGLPIKLARISVSLSNTIQGTLNYSAYKDVWYYYKENNNDNRHLYWVVKLDGTIPKGLTLQDTPSMHTAGSNTMVNINIEDVQLFRCSSSVDILSYETYEDFVNNADYLRFTGNTTAVKLGITADKGVPPDYSKIDLSGIQQDNNNYDYMWGKYSYRDGENHEGYIGEISFRKDIPLASDEVIYAVIRTDARYPVNTEAKTSNTAKVYENRLQLKEETATEWRDADKPYAMYVQKNAGASLKEGVSAFLIDGNNAMLSSTSANDQSKNTTRWKNMWRRDQLDEKGIYAEWILAVNWDGSISGMADVCDYLPEGFEPAYIELWTDWMASDTRDVVSCEIPEYESSDKWKNVDYYKFQQKNKETDGHFYFNPETNELRFRLDNLKMNENYKVKANRVPFILVCKVTDAEMLMTDGFNTVENTLEVTDSEGNVSTDSSTINIDTRASIVKTFGEQNPTDTIHDRISGNYTKEDTTLSFKIVVNPLEYDLSTDSTGMLPPLVDELSANLVFDSSLGVTAKYADGTEVTGYSVKYAENKLIINNLPADRKIVITYNARVNVPDLTNGVNIQNMAYWQGYGRTDGTEPQIKVMYNYKASGETELTTAPAIEIIKADSENIKKRLSGAVFDIYSVSEDGTQEFITSKTTGSDGKFEMTAQECYDSGIKYDKVYCIKEKTAPEGYMLDDNPHYFAIIQNTSTDLSGYKIKNIDVWYNSSKYSYTMVNNRDKISVEKNFQDSSGNDIDFYSGEYRFGIYTSQPSDKSSPVQILTISYDENGTPSYKLNGISAEEPCFTCAEPNTAYYIYELDSSGKPVTEDEFVSAGGHIFNVCYSSNLATTNEKYKIVTITNKVAVFDMPATGGKGTDGYYICGLSIISLFMLAWVVKRKS